MSGIGTGVGVQDHIAARFTCTDFPTHHPADQTPLIVLLHNILQYDLSSTTYSPDGKVFQTEYAQKAVDNSG